MLIKQFIARLVVILQRIIKFPIHLYDAIRRKFDKSEGWVIESRTIDESEVPDDLLSFEDLLKIEKEWNKYEH